jgi:hypothetical protein
LPTHQSLSVADGLFCPSLAEMHRRLGLVQAELGEIDELACPAGRYWRLLSGFRAGRGYLGRR